MFPIMCVSDKTDPALSRPGTGQTAKPSSAGRPRNSTDNFVVRYLVPRRWSIEFLLEPPWIALNDFVALLSLFLQPAPRHRNARSGGGSAPVLIYYSYNVRFLCQAIPLYCPRIWLTVVIPNGSFICHVPLRTRTVPI